MQTKVRRKGNQTCAEVFVMTVKEAILKKLIKDLVKVIEDCPKYSENQELISRGKEAIQR